MTKSKLLILGLASSFLVSGCATTVSSTVGTQHRAAVDDAISKQVISTTALKGAPELNAQRSAAAVERYVTDQVKQVDEGGNFSPGG